MRADGINGCESIGQIAQVLWTIPHMRYVYLAVGSADDARPHDVCTHPGTQRNGKGSKYGARNYYIYV